MTLPAFADTDALAARLPGGLAAADQTRAQAALDDASALIRSETGKTWVTGGETPTLADDAPDVIVTVCLTAARRALTNPDGIRSESAGAYNVSYSDASGDVYLTKEEKRRVRRAAGITGLGVIPVTRGDTDLPTYVDVVGSDEPLQVDLPGLT